MSELLDLGPATTLVGRLVAGISDDQLTAPTPCSAYTLGDLLDHVKGLSLAFTWAATKDRSVEGNGAAPSGDSTRLGADWRQRIPAQLTALAAAWRNPSAWTGVTLAGPVEMPGEVAGLVALNEVVVHGWDIARACGQPYEVDDASVGGALEFVNMFTDENRGDAFAPPVPTAADAPTLDQLIGLSGRNPAWTATSN